MTTYAKPLPVVDEQTRPFWEACGRGELTAQRCSDCGHLRWPVGPACTQCLSPDSDWVPLSGTGEVLSWIVYHHAFHPAFADDLPYNVALIRLDEGHTMISNLTEAETIRVGQRVEVVWDAVTDEITIPRFRPVAPHPGDEEETRAT